MTIRHLGLLALLSAGCEVGPETLGCTSDVRCPGGQFCHPTAFICVRACQGPAECPAGFQECASVTFAGQKSRPFCQCTSAQACGAGRLCSSVERVCQVPCRQEGECGPGRRCELSTGECVPTPAS